MHFAPSIVLTNMQSQYRFLKSELSKMSGSLSLLAVIYLIQAILLIAFPLPIKFALDSVLAGDLKNAIDFAGSNWRRDQLLIVLGLASISIGGFITLLEFIDEQICAANITRLVSSKKSKLIKIILNGQFNWIESKRKADLLGRLSGDTQNLELFVTSTFAVLFRAAPTLLFAICAMFYVNAQFALIVLVLLPLLYGSISLISNKIKFFEKRLRSKSNAYDQEALQTLNSSSLLKSLTAEHEALSRLDSRQKEINFEFSKTKIFASLLNAGFSISRNLLRTVVLIFGGFAILKGELSVGMLFAFVSYLEALNRPIGEITNLISRWGKANASLDRLIEVEEEALLNQEESSRGSTDIEGLDLLSLQEISFGYKNSKPLFSNISFSFPKSQLIALVGTSGVGKSSFIKILNHLNQPSSGEILINEIPADQFSSKQLRTCICVISQDSFFLSASIKENLVMGGVVASEVELWSSLRAVNADSFVKEFPDGLDTQIGEGGVQLSGGQSKRLSLARAFLRTKTSQAFVFDEPTSGLDPISSKMVMNSIIELSKEKIVLFSTHKIDELELATLVLYFEKDKNPHIATHEEHQQNSTDYENLVRISAEAQQ